MNPRCPEPKCQHLMRLRHIKTDLGIVPCPNCKGEESKRYILTPKKEGLRKCMRCRKDFVPVRREGSSRFWICPQHPWQKFKVGAEVIMCKEKSKNWRELKELVSEKKPFKAREQRRQPQFQMR